MRRTRLGTHLLIALPLASVACSEGNGDRPSSVGDFGDGATDSDTAGDGDGTSSGDGDDDSDGDGDGDGDLPIPTMSVNGSETSTQIEPGDPVQIDWSSTHATSCTASGTLPGWSGSQPSAGSTTISDTGSLAVGTSYTVQLTCSNDTGTSPRIERMVNVVDPEPQTVGCDERPLLGEGDLSHWTRKTTGLNSCVWKNPTQGGGLNTEADCRFFDQVWPLPWPGSQNTRNLTILGNEGRQFIAMEFNSGNIPTDHMGRITQEVPQFDGANSGFKMWSISKCPGDYNKALIDAEMGPNCIWRELFGFIESFNYGGPGYFDDPSRCALQPNTVYYLNIIWTDDLPGTEPAQIMPREVCVTERCGMNATPAGIYDPNG